MTNAKDADVMEKLVSLSKRRGFVYPASEIYGGLNGCWDYGHLGVELKRNIKERWWRAMVLSREDIVGIDGSILMNPQVWHTTGHVDNFTDQLSDCLECKGRFRSDHLEDRKKCPKCGGKLTEPRQFNLMFRTELGAVEGSFNTVYLRPETAQSIFCNFKNTQQAARLKPPFGIAQIGKAFRNEINPRYFVFRCRELEQMEMEYFVPPARKDEFFQYWRQARMQWHIDNGLRPDRLHFRDHDKAELAHYSDATTDIEFDFPFGCSELEGIASRTDFDLKRHAEASGKDLWYFDDQTRERYFPYVIEPALGVDRCVLAILCDAYDEEKDEEETRVVMRFHPAVAPVKVGVLPLVKKEGMPDIARKIHQDLNGWCRAFYDESGAVGRRYRRLDEIGAPYCVTVDGETLTNQSVTLRLRDPMTQERVNIADLEIRIRQLDKEYRRR